MFVACLAARHPGDQQHGERHPSKSRHHVIDEVERAVRAHEHDLRERHSEERPHDDEGEQRHGPDELANARPHETSIQVAILLSARPRSIGSRIMKMPVPAGDARGLIRLWIACLAALVFAMVVVGGATRLTQSGLSIVEWRPVTGVVPPLSQAQWQVEFDKYKTIPQYQRVNRGMSLDEFKTIFWWEWSHRLLG